MAIKALVAVLILMLLGTTLYTPVVLADDGDDAADDEDTPNISVTLTVNVVQPAPAPTGGGRTYSTTNTNYCGVAGYFLIDRDGRVIRTVTAGCEDGDLIVTIEKNTIALDENGKALQFLTIYEDPDPPPLPEGNNFIGLPFKLEPAGATFVPPLIFTWTYDPEDIPEGETPTIVYWDGDKWITLTGIVDTENHTVTAEVSHFTTFALVVPIPVVKPEPVVPVPEKPEVEEPEVIEPEPEKPEVEEPVVEEPVVEEPTVEEPEKPEVTVPKKPSYLWAYILGGVSAVGAGLYGLWRRRRKKEENS